MTLFMQMYSNSVLGCILMVHTKCAAICSLWILHEPKGTFQVTSVVCTEAADFHKMAVRLLFPGKFSWNICLWLQTYADSAFYVFF